MMSNKFFMYLPLYFITAFCVVKNASAQTYTGPYATGMGGAGRASVSPLEAAYMNPAQLAFISQSHFYGAYLDEEIQGEDVNKFAVAGVDTQTSSLFPGALTFTHGKIDTGAGEIKTRNYELSLGRREFEQMAFGITLKRQEWDGLNQKEADHDFNFGMTYAPMKELGLAFVTYNVLEDSKDRTPRKYALGSYYIFDPFGKIALDLAYQKHGNADKGLDIMGGFAVPFGVVDLMFGYSKLSVIKEEFFTTGFVWNGPRLSLAYAYRDGSKGSKTHNVDFGLFF